MIYTTGTVAISGNTVTGTGTNFTQAGTLIRVGCTLITMSTPIQLFQITAISNATQLVVTPAATPALPAGTSYAILLSDSLSVDGLAQNVSETLGMYQRNISGFADVMNATGDVTITVNNQQLTVPGQKSINNKAEKNDKRLDTVDGKSGGAISGTVEINGAAYFLSNAAGFGEIGFKFPATKQRLSYAFTENFGDLVFVTTAAAQPGTEKYFSMRQNGNFTTQGNISCVSLTQTSDETEKEKTEVITDALDKLNKINGYTFNWKESGMPSAGILAQEVMEVLPECISTEWKSKKGKDEQDLNDRRYGVEYSGVVGLLVAALKEEVAKRKELSSNVDSIISLIELALDNPEACKDKISELRSKLSK